MSWFRLTVLALSMTVLGASCNCARPPVSNTLKSEGEACSNDEECESSLCDKLPGKSQVCFRKCSAVCKAGDICTALKNKSTMGVAPRAGNARRRRPAAARGCAAARRSARGKCVAWTDAVGRAGSAARISSAPPAPASR